ncbi:HAD family hydrolase [Streptococcus macacae]|uniref:Haloacid dehalogenase-like hydrolase n=1 Tax=Streptococcus macacae NCTC 11558 TaxID=764298 RepID=G5JYN6_9STRE|nr:HAD family hydrolase [Streptococcus macacae]EHJ51704.1 haloacid dehalogenase-like hydrolase [Streptococcus macacae NCTC 11558]SUN78149.1 hydrolase [Streptococcus macacae NCTC 11558]
MITAIVFDVDDTIYDQQAPYRQAMQKSFPDFDVSQMNQAYIRFRHYSDTGFPKVISGKWTTEYFRIWRCQQTLAEFGYPHVSEEEGSHFQAIYENELDNITMLDEMRLTLDFLKKKKVPIGVITNGPTEHQLKKVKRLGLYDYVEPKRVIVSQATGFQKPEKEIFNLAAEQFDMNPGTTLYVGDSYDNDIMGAFNGGWHSMWFNHRGRSLQPGTKPVFDLEIDSFDQLFGAVKVLFDLPDNKFIFDLQDKENPILQMGIDNGLMIAAERLLESNMSIDKVVILLRLNPSQEKILRLKYASRQ